MLSCQLISGALACQQLTAVGYCYGLWHRWSTGSCSILTTRQWWGGHRILFLVIKDWTQFCPFSSSILMNYINIIITFYKQPCSNKHGKSITLYKQQVCVFLMIDYKKHTHVASSVSNHAFVHTLLWNCCTINYLFFPVSGWLLLNKWWSSEIWIILHFKQQHFSTLSKWNTISAQHVWVPREIHINQEPARDPPNMQSLILCWQSLKLENSPAQ